MSVCVGVFSICEGIDCAGVGFSNVRPRRFHSGSRVRSEMIV